MTEVLGELARVRQAFAQPTLTLLHRQQALVTVTLFRCCFSRETTQVPAARLHQLLDNLLADMRAAGAPEAPVTATGRDLCQNWVKGQWLVRSPGQDDEDFYTLTSHAQTAMTLVEGMTRDRATLSEHRIATIVDTVRRFNAAANPSRTERMRLLEEQIAALAAERDRLAGGGDLEPVRDDYMLEGYAEVLSLVAGLPSDFKRVQEAFEGLRREIMADFRLEERPAGAVIDTYLAKADNLMSATPEGRAFEGAFTLLRNPDLLLALREDLDALLEHPSADQILTGPDRRELRSTLLFIRKGIEDVLTQRQRATKVIKDYVRNHDAARDRQLDSTLRQLDTALDRWLARTGPRARLTNPLLPESIDLDYLPRRFHDPTPQDPPPPLTDATAPPPESSSLADMLAWGGPSLAELRLALTRSAEGTGGDQPATLGELFTALGPEMHRPVEVFGLLHLAANAAHASLAEGTEAYLTVRPDGSRRTLHAPRIELEPAAPTHRETP